MSQISLGTPKLKIKIQKNQGLQRNFFATFEKVRNSGNGLITG
jgi:hypothetical protein